MLILKTIVVRIYFYEILFLLFFLPNHCIGQTIDSSGKSALYSNSANSLVNSISNFPSFLNKVNSKTDYLKKQLNRQTNRYLKKFSKREAKLKKRLFELDSNSTKKLFLSNPEQEYRTYMQKAKADSVFDEKKFSAEYLPYSDSLQGVLSFMNKNPQFLAASNSNAFEIQRTINKLQQLQSKIQTAEQIKQYFRQRKEEIKQSLLGLAHLPSGITNIYKSYNKELFYYNQQVNEYKEILNDPDKMFKRLLAILDKLPAFQTFIKNNSVLASLFPLPGNYGTPLALAGLQTRDQMMSFIRPQLSGPNSLTALNQNISNAQSQLNQLKDKVMKYGNGGGDVDIPNFTPSETKTKTFFKRLEYGMNFQTQHSTNYFPTTTDVGLSVGYKMNKNVVGFGASYKIGWGTDISHIDLSSQGIGLRSYLDINVKKSFYASGGLEYNYQQPFNSIGIINNLKKWQQSGLIGISKIVSMKTKVFKKTKLQFLWDFLSYQQNPRGEPLKFRVGYSF